MGLTLPFSDRMIAQHVKLDDLLLDRVGARLACSWNGESYFGKIVAAGENYFIESDDKRLPRFTARSPHKFIKEVVKHIELLGQDVSGRSWQCVYLVEDSFSGEKIPLGSKTLLQVKREFAEKIAAYVG